MNFHGKETNLPQIDSKYLCEICGRGFSFTSNSFEHFVLQDKGVSPVFFRLAFGVALPGLAGEEVALCIGGVLIVAVGDS